jgi:hypothetical protein
LHLAANEAGQVIEGLQARQEFGQRTAKYLQIGYADGDIEGCRNAYEACSIAAFYRIILDKVQRQVDEQRE